jgi:hypothetical protein
VSMIFLVLVVQEWLQTTHLIQITLGFRKAEDDTKDLTGHKQWQKQRQLYTTVSLRLQQFSQNYWQQCKTTDKLVVNYQRHQLGVNRSVNRDYYTKQLFFSIFELYVVFRAYSKKRHQLKT